ncbi:MAG: type I restriction enzyme HsdR N-terminal domain-containing protein [Bacteroidaceae bacterium]|nr:type I restriction enzyme HsdR N-terminal domain-containing protein [Bacteroidaceae bacterium]
MFQINLPPYETNIRQQNGRSQIFDILRRRYVALTPEEWVRQHFIHFLIDHKGYPSALMANEISLSVNGMWRRCDSVLFSKLNSPRMIMEYKAPSVKITQSVFSQINAYNQVLRVPYLVVSNGMQHYCCFIDYEQNAIRYLTDIPAYSDLKP